MDEIKEEKKQNSFVSRNKTSVWETEKRRGTRRKKAMKE